MDPYPLLVFVHVLAAVGIFVALGLEAVALGRLRLAGTPANARASLGALSLPTRMGPVAMAATLASGMWMMATVWGHAAWIVAAFAGVVAMAIVGGALSQRRIRRLHGALAAEQGPDLSRAFQAAASSAALVASVRIRLALGTGILALMTVKPAGVATSSLVLAAAAVAGLVAALPGVRRSPLARAPFL